MGTNMGIVTDRANLDYPDTGREIQVSGLDCFPGNRWREAILYYLNGIWADRECVTYRPKIHFGNVPKVDSWQEVVLRLDRSLGEYYAYGTSAERPPRECNREAILVVGCGQTEVEQGLIRFVKNNRIRQLWILLRGQEVICLFKTRERGFLGVSADGIPPSLL